jgi:hypothetical protein
MPFDVCHYAWWNRLNKIQLAVVDAGINWFIYGHKAKFSLNWQNRPVYAEDPDKGVRETGRRIVWFFNINSISGTDEELMVNANCFCRK